MTTVVSKVKTLSKFLWNMSLWPKKEGQKHFLKNFNQNQKVVNFDNFNDKSQVC